MNRSIIVILVLSGCTQSSQKPDDSRIRANELRVLEQETRIERLEAEIKSLTAEQKNATAHVEPAIKPVRDGQASSTTSLQADQLATMSAAIAGEKERLNIIKTYLDKTVELQGNIQKDTERLIENSKRRIERISAKIDEIDERLIVVEQQTERQNGPRNQKPVKTKQTPANKRKQEVDDLMRGQPNGIK